MLTYSINESCKGKDGSASAGGWKTVTTSVEDLLIQTAGEGYAVMAATMRNGYKVNENIQEFNVLIIDIDNDDGETTWSEAVNNQFIASNAVCMWTSTNHKKDDGTAKYHGQDRYRILFKLPEPFRICDPKFDKDSHRKDVREISNLLERIQDMIPGSDKQCKWSSCIFGTDEKVVGDIHIFNEDHVLSMDSVPQRVEKRKDTNHNHTSKVRYDTEDSLARVKNWLEVIPSDTESNWKTVGSSLRNIQDSIGGEEVALQLYEDWSSRDYDVKPGEPERMFLGFDSDPDEGGWGRMKSLAEDNGYEPPASSLVVDVAELFPPVEGFKVTDESQPLEPGIISRVDVEKGSKQILMVTKTQGTIDISYTQTKSLMPMHLSMALEATILKDHDVRFNVATRTIEMDGAEIPPEHLDALRFELSEIHQVNFPAETPTALLTLAMRHSYDPYAEELEAIEKNVQPMDISNLATRYFKSTTPLADLMMEKWLTAMVGRILEPGLPFRGTLVVKGQQNIGKDCFVNTICGSDDRVVSLGSNTKLKDVNTMLALSRAWVANFDEIERVTSSQVTGELKSWLTQTSDAYAVKHRMTSRTFPRRFVTYGSCNEAKFLKDLTGNTRYWVIESALDWIGKGEQVDRELLSEEREAILAQAIQNFRAYQRGEYTIELDQEEQNISEEHNKEFVEDAVYVEQLMAALDGRTTTCMSEVYDILDLKSGHLVDRRIINKIDQSLKQLGFNKERSPRKVMSEGIVLKSSVKVWVRGESTPSELIKHFAEDFNRDF